MATNNNKHIITNVIVRIRQLFFAHATFTAWKVSQYKVFSVPNFLVFGLNTGKYSPEKTPYLDTFHAVLFIIK